MDKIIINSLHNIKKNMQSFLNKEFKDLNLKSSEVILLRVLNCEGKLSQTTLARKLDCDKAHIHRITNKLLDKDLIIFAEVDSQKSRNLILELTKKGKVIISQINNSMENWIKQIKQGINEDDLETFKRVVEKLIFNANNINMEKYNG